MLICARFLQLGILGPNITTISADESRQTYRKETVYYESDPEAWDAMDRDIGVKSDEDGALRIGASPTNIELMVTVAGGSKLRVNFSPQLSDNAELVVFGERNFVLRSFVLASALAYMPCDRKFECLQPRNAEFERPICGNYRCMVGELLQIRNFIDFWTDPQHVYQLPAEDSGVSGENSPPNVRWHRW